jgi:uncharacterized membrane protein YeaQ/YmgE (transglycosylase-associated protein family)
MGIGEIIVALIFGLIVGAIAKAIMPGDDPGGVFVTALIGIAGSLVGWFIFASVLGIGDGEKFDLGGIVGAILGTLLLLGLYRMLVGNRHRTTAGPGTGARF